VLINTASGGLVDDEAFAMRARFAEVNIVPP
jgi:hypothetical protein